MDHKKIIYTDPKQPQDIRVLKQDCLYCGKEFIPKNKIDEK